MIKHDCSSQNPVLPVFLKRRAASLAMVLLLVRAGGTLAESPLLIDNFTGTNNPNPQDINFGLAARQAGSSLGTVTWSRSGPNVQLGNALNPNALLVGGDGNSSSGLASPDHSFSGSEVANGLVIEFDIDPQHSTFPFAWQAINVGMSDANRWGGVNAAGSHLGILFTYDGNCQAWDGATAVGSFPNGVLPNTFTKVRLQLTDPTDGNPLDGVGQTTLVVYIAGSSTPAFTYTKGSGGLAGGYINFQGTPADLGLIDNLSIARLVVPPPAVDIATYAGLTITGLIGQTYGVQATPTPDKAESWKGVANVALTNATQLWHDIQSTVQQPKRFYRVIPGPIQVQ